MSDPFYTKADFVPERSIGYLVHRLKKLGTARAETLFADQDINLSQWIAMFHIRYRMAITAAEISKCLGHNSGAVTRMLDQLDERGLILRTRDQADRRVVKLEMTEAGQTMLSRLTPVMMDLWNEHLSIFTRDEAETLITLLQRLLGTLADGEDKA
ncbi:MarR family winged helix-turn-helix transcriptional regulator [Sphingomonas montanisoli]|uniref:Winged helix-turn-helix transcriptional regulator n=1 Tax=Sphingomonas montanisoli TaxID=2606412 RepID=A0A5D9C7A0_9SPHN|nr:MarR family winged helix-turn-helix transcriptional regulator [Sphingomonas montanisoli]TZG25915.1 winged helix-turn-helix transcriptional regulator [Sphingomonas montanisoli]